MSSVSDQQTRPPPPGPTEWGRYMQELYSSRRPPYPLGTVLFAEIEAKAKEKLKETPGSFMYVFGSAGTNATYRANVNAFSKYGIIPRMLVNASVRSLETEIFGVKHSSPLFIAPVGVQGILHADAELASAEAAANLGVPFIMSTASSRSIEEVAKANRDSYRWYQLYWPKHDAVTLSILSRIKQSGFKALVVTLDTMSLGWRPHDLQDAYLPFAHGVGIQVGRSDPTFMALYDRTAVHEHPAFPYVPHEHDKKYLAGDPSVKDTMFFGKEWLGEANSGVYRGWEDLKFLRDNWEGPLVLKGIQCAEDAEKAIEFGANGIIVSNHGGRQLDGAIPSLYALANIMKSEKVREAQRAGSFTVLFDSGIRTGSDIIKALALGAQAVLLARPWLYGLVSGGREGVEQVIKHTLADLDISLGNAGYRSLAELQGKGELVVAKLDL